MAPVVVGRRCAPLDSAGIFFRGPRAAGWLKLWWNSYLPPIHSLCAQDTDRILANHIQGARCVRLFTAWSSDDPGCLPFTSPSSSFFGEFASLLEQFALYNTHLVIAGDFSLHLEDPFLPASTEFRTIIDQFGLV